jgi:hypothetical protein
MVGVGVTVNVAVGGIDVSVGVGEAGTTTFHSNMMILSGLSRV